MNFIQKLFAAAEAVQAGKSLQDPAKWKNRQLTLNALLIIIGTAARFANLELSESDLNAISYGITILLSVINVYFIPATSEKVGIPVKH